jgi:hypothetical protein
MIAIALLLLGCAPSGVKSDRLTRAVRDGDVAAVRALCARGADPNQMSGGNGWTLLLHAVHRNQLGTAAALLDAGADVNLPSSKRLTPLMMAAGYGNREMVALFLRHGANPRAVDLDGLTALDYALMGMLDVDQMTFFRCQAGTAALLAPSSPPPQRSSLRWAGIKGCG